jgi:hypothetical protein
MSEPGRGAFPHQHGDPRRLRERIQAQLYERIEEAVEMASLALLVELRRRQGRPAPEEASEVDRREFQANAETLLVHLRETFHSSLTPEQRAALARAEAGARTARERLLLGQVFLARLLPDYWQRFEALQAAHAEARLGAPPPAGWLTRLLRRS